MSSDRLRALGAHVAQQQDLLNADPSEAVRRRLVEHVLERGRDPRRPNAPRSAARRWLALAAGVSLALVGLWLGSSPSSDAALSFTVGSDRAGVLQALQAAPSETPLPIRFSDGSLLDLAPSARARVAALGADGADLVLESGRARLDVVPRRERQRASWQIRSGPFAVHVKGTSFGLSWDPEQEAFTLDLFSGEVLVTGCGLGNGRELRAGERLEASCRPRPAPVELPAVDQTGAAAPLGLHEPRAPRASPQPSRRAAQTRSTWQRLARQGNFGEAVALIERRGWSAEIAGASGDELLLLGQAARVTRHPAEAERAYRAVRSRFAGSPAAARAAYSLGLLTFEQDPARASEWLETYLAEQPRGPLAESALERLLEVALRGGDAARQRNVARRYLEQSATGPHAAEARRILAGSTDE